MGADIRAVMRRDAERDRLLRELGKVERCPCGCEILGDPSEKAYSEQEAIALYELGLKHGREENAPTKDSP